MKPFLVHLHRMWLLHHSFANVKTRISIPCSVPEIWYHCLECHRKHETAVDKDCKNLNSCCKLELENIFISCFNNSSLHYWVTFEKNIFFHIHWYYLKENFFYPMKTAPSPQLFRVFCHMKQLWTWCCFHGWKKFSFR